MSTKVKAKININVSEDVIDIPGNKLLEWLLDRKKIGQHWKRSQNSLLKLINDACEQTSIEKKQYSYFDCQKIFKEFEQQPGGNSTTLFGSYSNVNTQKWYEVIKAYEKDHYHIAESCQIFTNNLNYEIPALKKTIEKSIKILEDDSKKSYEKNKNSAINSFKKACSDLGIKGERIRDEIIELPLQLNSIFDEISKLVHSNDNIISAIQFYQEILEITKVVLSNDKNGEPLPLLSFLVKYGNLTMVERERILNPTKEILVQQNQQSNSDGNESGNIEIDWCMDIKSGELNKSDSGVNKQLQPTIVWDDDTGSGETQTIQWSDDFSMDTIELVEESSNHFEITLESSGDTNGEQKEDVKIQDSSISNDNANNGSNNSKSNNSKESYDPNDTILSTRSLRNQFLDELYELDIFLNNRVNEMEKSTIFGLDQIINDNSKSTVSTTQCKEYSKLLNEIIGKLTSNRVKQILEIKSSKKFIDRLVLQFTQKQQVISKCNQQIKDNQDKIESFNITLGESKSKINQLTKETRILKSNLEQLISTLLFDKKKINLMIPYSLN